MVEPVNAEWYDPSPNPFLESLTPSFASDSYTPTEETHCIGNVCTMTMHSGVMFTKESDGLYHALPEVSNIAWENGGFNFSYRDYWVLIEPFVIYNGNFKTVQDIKTAFPNVDIKEYISTNRFNHKFAVNFSNVPQNLLDNTDYIGLRLKDSHGLTWNDVRKTSDQSIAIKNKVEINYADLIDSGFTLDMVNKTYLLIGNISNNSADGMIYIDPTISLGADANEVLTPEYGNITLGTNEYSVTNTYQTTLVPTIPSITDNVTQGTIAETTHPAVTAGTILTAAQYAMVNATGGTQYTVAGSTTKDVYFEWNITLPQTDALNWVQVLATMNTSGTTDLKHIALWNFTSGAWVNAFSATYGTTFTNATFNITGTNLTWFVRNNKTIYFLPHGSGTATGNLGIDYLEAKVSYNNTTSSNAGNWTNVTASDNSYWIIKTDANAKAGANFTYTIGLSNPSSIQIDSEFKQSATSMNLRVYIYNFTGSAWYDLSGTDMNPTVDTWYNYTITSGVSDFINNTKIHSKIESSSNGAGSGYLFIDDPVITLNETNGGNVGDAHIALYDPTGNYGTLSNISVRTNVDFDRRVLLMWALSVVPAGSTIIDANLPLWRFTASAADRYYLIYNTTNNWTESNITWNTQPVIGTLQDNISMPASTTGLSVWNITNAAINSFAQTNKNLSVIIKDNSEGSAISRANHFYSKEYTTDTTKRPQLVITYIAGDTTPPTYSDNSTNSTLAGTPVSHNLYWTDNAGLSGYIFQFCNGTWNGTNCIGNNNVNITQLTYDLYWGAIYNSSWDAESFNYTENLYIDSIKLLLKKQLGSPVCNATIYIKNDTGGNLPGATTYYTSVPLNTSTLTADWLWYGFNFSSAIINSSTKYWFTIQGGNGCDDTNYFSLKWNSTGNLYVNGDSAWTTTSGVIWDSDSVKDLTFMIEGSTIQGWVNDSFVPMTGATNWSNVTKIINSTTGANISWCVYANDTVNNWNGTSCASPFSYLTTSAGGNIYESFLNIKSKAYLNIPSRITNLSRTLNVVTHGSLNSVRVANYGRLLNVVIRGSNTFSGIYSIGIQMFERFFNIIVRSSLNAVRGISALRTSTFSIKEGIQFMRVSIVSRLINIVSVGTNDFVSSFVQGLQAFERWFNIAVRGGSNFIRGSSITAWLNVRANTGSAFQRIISLSKLFNQGMRLSATMVSNSIATRFMNIFAKESSMFMRGSVVSRMYSNVMKIGSSFNGIYKSLFNIFERILSIPVRIAERFIVIIRVWVESQVYDVCSILQQIEDSPFYICIKTDGTWKILIRGAEE